MKVARSIVAILVGVMATLTITPMIAGGDVCWNYKRRDRAMTRKINRTRANRDRVKLQLDPHLSKVARRHTKSMADANVLNHTKALGKKVTRWRSLGENVGYGFSVKNLHNMFMDSSAHRENILKRRFRYIGVGTVKSGGWVWTTVVFESKRNPGTTLSMPSC